MDDFVKWSYWQSFDMFFKNSHKDIDKMHILNCLKKQENLMLKSHDK